MATMAAAAAAVQLIQQAQDGEYAVGNHGRLPPFSTALQEIEAGAKRSHWIWYVWPSLRPVRPEVRLPQFLLPDITSGCAALLVDPVLRSRLHAVSAAVRARSDFLLRCNAKPPSVLAAADERRAAPCRRSATSAPAARCRGCSVSSTPPTRPSTTRP